MDVRGANCERPIPTSNIMSNQTQIFNITAVDDVSIQKILDRTALCLTSGGIVALPTDTIYGIACCVNSNDGIKKLYDIKKRNLKNPIAICVAEVEDMERWANITVSKTILKRLFPGQATGLFTRKEELNPYLNPNTSLIGIRVPDHDFIRQLVNKCQCPIALTSANKSGHKSTLQIEEFREIWDEINVIIDEGRIASPESPECRKGSTVINFSFVGHFEIVREGSSCENIIKTLLKYDMKENINLS